MAVIKRGAFEDGNCLYKSCLDVAPYFPSSSGRTLLRHRPIMREPLGLQPRGKDLTLKRGMRQPINVHH